MKKIQVIISICFLLGFANANAHNHEEPIPESDIIAFIKTIFQDNNEHVNEVSKEEFKSFADDQSPRATVISCSDSRVQTNSFHKSPVNDLFFIRNIGNQIATTEGSVDYGIYHLHTPVLLIIGHSHCGAIKAALGNYSKEANSIKKELDHLHLNKGTDVNAGVVSNVNRQVDQAMKKYQHLIKKKELVVLGAVYDFRDEFKKGHGRLILINLNGNKNPSDIKGSPYIKDIEEIYVD